MKKMFFLAFATLFISQFVQAETIETSSRFGTIYGYQGGAVKVMVTFAKMSFPKEYGILARVDFIGNDGDRRRQVSKTAFFRPTNGQFVRADKELYFINNDGVKTLVATKRFLGWKPVANVDLEYEVSTAPGRIVIDAWAEIN